MAHNTPLPFSRPVLLAGGGDVSGEELDRAERFGSDWIALDGGADRLDALGRCPRAILGDLDSVSDPERWRARDVPILETPDQNRTDFDKALSLIDAPLILAVGCLGPRHDHALAAMRSLVLRARGSVVLLSPEEACLHWPDDLVLDLEVDTRVSFFPLTEVRGTASVGLRWPIDGLDFHPMGQIGTSNAATGGPMQARFSGPGMLGFLPVDCLDQLVRALSNRAR